MTILATFLEILMNFRSKLVRCSSKLTISGIGQPSYVVDVVKMHSHTRKFDAKIFKRTLVCFIIWCSSKHMSIMNDMG